MYGLPAFYWLIDEGEEKDLVLQQTQNGERQANNRKKRQSINLVCFCCTWLTLLIVDDVGRDPMTLRREVPQHGLVTFVHYSTGLCRDLMSQSDLPEATLNEVK